MLRDVFYYGKKPNVHPREKHAKNLAEARKKATTEHFWIINEFCDYVGFDWDFDFEFLPDEDVWAENHNNVWPSTHQKDSGTWLCAKKKSDVIIYRADVDPVKRKNEITKHWKFLDNIDKNKWDFSWHPDPTDPPFIYCWGSKYAPVELKTCLEYHVDGATNKKYMTDTVELLPNYDCLVKVQNVDESKWDMSWRPSPLDPPYIYVWGNKHIDGRLKSTLEYHVPGATEKKYMPDLIPVLPEWDRWTEHVSVDKTKFDFTWRPDPREPDFIYVWGNKYEPGEIKPTLEYKVPGATEVKYMTDQVDVLPEWERWEIIHPIDKNTFDFRWRPDPREPNLNYVFGNDQYDSTVMPTIMYKMKGATDEKHMPSTAKLLPSPSNFQHLENSYGIDYSWVPDPKAPPYIYVWGNQWNKPEDKISIQYVVEGATEYKYMAERATRSPSMDNWELPDNIDVTHFDFSWEPSPASPPYIYQFGTQWQKTGGPRYVVEGATEVKYIDIQKARALPNRKNWTVPAKLDITGFDFSWHPDDTSPPYIYHFATQWALTGGPIYTCEGATEVKYLDHPSAIALPDKTNWQYDSDLIDEENFDFSWHPYVEDQPYVYVFGTQHQKTGGPKYITPGALSTSPVKYIDTRIIKAIRKPNKDNFAILNNYKIKDFDWSWHPDETEEPYIYVFGNTQYSAEIMPTIEYAMPGAKQIKYVPDVVATLDIDMGSWEIPKNIDTTDFDFSWKPNPKDPAYIYEFGTQHQKTGGPRYVVPGATEVKYVTTQQAKALPTESNWTVPSNLDITGFDFSWHPDNTSPPYIYHFATQWALTGGPIYTCESATEVKYLEEPSAVALPTKENWVIPADVDVESFDFSWHPYIEDQPYVYVFGTQHQKTGGPKYMTPGVQPGSPIKYIDRRILQAKRISNKDNFAVLNNYKIKDFDFSWHPDDTEEPYIYVFGNNQYSAEIMPTVEYTVPGAKQIKYVTDIIATLDVDMTNWEVPTDVDTTDFDFSWKPNPKDPAYIYEFGTQWQKTGGPRYVVPGATETKYIDTMRVKKLADKSKFAILDNLIIDEFDYSWHPDSTEEPYIYVFGNNLYPATIMPTIEYAVAGAKQIKYIDVITAKLGVDKTNWIIPENVDASIIDYNWKPNPKDPPYIYQFGTQWQKTGGPRYVVPGATSIKYVEMKVTAQPRKENFAILDNLVIEDFDYSWHPDDTDQPYIYLFGNTQHPAEIMPTIEYRVEGAKQVKYVHNVVAKLGKDMTNWEVPEGIDTSDFDFSWKPNPKDPAYIYEFGTQWQKTGGPRYVVPGAEETKYVSTQTAKALPSRKRWSIPSNIDVTGFDFSWHPDSTSPAYIYHFATQWALTGGPIYTCEGATEVKYLEYPSAIALPNRQNWELPTDIDVDSFDFSWHPYVEDQPYVYQFGTQHQKTGGPRYITPGVIPTSPIKYIDTRIIKAKKLPNKENFAVLNNYKIKDFDWSWHPDDTEEPYIYVFGNTQYPAEIMPTIEYAMPNAKTIKYVSSVLATLDVDMTNWEVPECIDTTDFDFSWKPNPKDPAYIYEFGTQWQKTGGPRYVVPGATEVKYVTTQKVKMLPSMSNWKIPEYVDVTNFDFSWHPDSTSPAYIYHFATQWALTGGPVYEVEGATEVKYLEEPSAVALSNKQNWEIPNDIDVDSFDFSWHPYVEDQPYVYIFGTQHQKTGGPKYITPGVIPTSPIKYIDARILKATKLPNKDNFAILNNYKIKDFDWSWHPDETEEPYIYVFGNTQYPAEIMPTVEYAMPGAKQIKYVSDVVATLDVDMTNWEVPTDIDTSDFDFSWKPNPKDPAYIYEFGTQWQKTGGPRYVSPNATEVKYIETQKVKALPTTKNWSVTSHVDVTSFDFSWHPDNTSPPYIYHFATQWALTGGPIYTCEGATEVKYLEEPNAVALPNKTNWEIPEYVEAEEFDYSWHPYVEDQPYIYQFGTQHQKTGGHRYITPGVIPTSPIKYIDTRILKSKRKQNKSNFSILNNYKIKDFDWSWHPDETEEPYIYVFGNNQYPAEIMPTIEYAVSGAKQIKYVSDIIATLAVDMTNWEVPTDVDTSDFDFSWKPNPKDPAYIYEFGTQWQKTGGPRYVVHGATETKYVTTQKVKALPNKDKWELPSNIDVTNFDFSWHPDNTSPPYIYHFATQWALSGGPIYRMDGATEVKYMEEPCAVALPNKQNWEIPTDIDSSSFDFSWHPYVEDQPYVYQFGTQWQKTSGPKYITPGVIPTSPVKYIDTRILKANKLPNRNNFSILNNYKVKDFDWSWHPDETEEPYIYVFGNTQYAAEIMPTIEYAVPGATKTKYVHDVVAKLAEDRTNWEIPDGIDVSEFDFSWKPNPKDPAYIYEFGTQWQKTGGPRYVVPGATQVKYVADSKARALPNKHNWILPKDLNIEDFDYSWHPDATEGAYIYVFPTQWQLTAGPRYFVEGATEFKYMDEPCAKTGPNMKHWEIPSGVTIKDFDFSWHPHPDDPTFIYDFATQWHDRGGPRYVAPGSNKDTPVKYIDSRVIKATLDKNMNNWQVPEGLDVSNFDFSWVPHPNDPPYIYEFGTQWQKTGGPKYVVPKATEVKYIEVVKAKRLPSKSHWFNPYQSDTTKFDYSWHPDATSPPYIYQFGTLLDRNDGPRYITPDSKGDVIYLPRVETDEVIEEVIQETIIPTQKIVVEKYYIETTLEDLVNKHPNEVFWALNNNIDYTDFDFEWRPEIINVEWESNYVHVFGSKDAESTHTYFVNAKSYLNGNKDLKFIEDAELNDTYLSKLFIKPDMFFVDKGNKESQQRFEQLKEKYGNVQKTRYLNSWVDTINRCINRSSTNLCWILNSELDYSKFNFNYYPNPWQMKMVHVFGTQWNHWGTTFLVNRESFPTDTKYIKIIEHLSNLNFVKDRIAIASNVVHDIIYVDHSNLSEDEISNIKNAGHLVVQYEEDYLTTFKKILSKLPEKKEHYVWIASTICEYDNFDFSYVCDPFAREQLHVFPSDKQQYGDTFFVNVNKLRELINQMSTLKDYDKINYNQRFRASRVECPTIVTEFDSHVASVMEDFSFPYATFITSDNKDIDVVDEEPMSLWDKESKNILITSTGGTRIVVPREAKQYVETQLYDYPYIRTMSRLAKSNPLDIVFLSNGEKCADENYEHLIKITKGLPNRIVRVDGIKGRVQAYHAAAEASNTPWMFTVFAKLKVNAKFDFNWQPDRLQVPKHYMFLAKNPVNGLIYGHQGMIAYNKQMTLDNEGSGLDFTLDSPHDTVELLSGIATYNTDEFSTWRTAFREAVKLRKENSEISLKRLEAWLTKGEGDFASYSIDGANHGIEYFDKVKGKTEKLRLSYEWDWLKKQFNKKYKK